VKKRRVGRDLGTPLLRTEDHELEERMVFMMILLGSAAALDPSFDGCGGYASAYELAKNATCSGAIADAETKYNRWVLAATASCRAHGGTMRHTTPVYSPLPGECAEVYDGQQEHKIELDAWCDCGGSNREFVQACDDKISFLNHYWGVNSDTVEAQAHGHVAEYKAATEDDCAAVGGTMAWSSKPWSYGPPDFHSSLLRYRYRYGWTGTCVCEDEDVVYDDSDILYNDEDSHCATEDEVLFYDEGR
jgi:hypothetical protein